MMLLIANGIPWPLILLSLRYSNYQYLKLKEKQQQICKIPFFNKDVELINLPRIFHDPSVKVCLYVDINFDYPTVICSLNNPIRSKIFNFNKCIYDLDVEVFLKDNSVLLRNCEGSNFIEKDQQHKVTGDLRIMNINKLSNLLPNGPA